MKRLLVLALILAGCSAAGSSQTTAPSDAQDCGIERWSVKTLRDSATVNFTLRVTTIAELSAPSQTKVNLNTPRLPIEMQAVQVTAEAIAIKRETDDNDWHLILRDSAGNTMISEVPDPTCAELSNSPHAAEWTAVRQWITDSLGKPTTSFKTVSRWVTVTGVPFQDFSHGQTDAAPNQIEIHPILSIR